MNLSRCLFRTVAPTLVAVMALSGSGCSRLSTLFVAKHKVLVDAISAPGVTKPSGLSYRLIARRSVVSKITVQVPVVAACVHAALGGQGMFEAPPNAPSDIFVEVGFGIDSAPRVDPASRETFLQLSARSNPGRSMDRATGPELWDVRVAVLGVPGRIEAAMPLLCAVAATYLATDTHLETKVEIPQNSPMISAVRENAIKVLDGANNPGDPAQGASAASAASAKATPK